MTETQVTLLKLIRSVLDNKKTDVSMDIDWDEMCVLAHRHSVLPILYKAVELNELSIGDEYIKLLKAKYFSAVFLLANQQHWSEKVASELSRRGVRYLPLKGQSLRELYPSPEMRTSCDIDIYYDSSQSELIEEIMNENSFSFFEKGENHDTYTRGEVSIEFHYLLMPPNAFFYKYYNEVWDKLVSIDGCRHKFKDEDNYIYIILHFLKHFLGGGGGIRGLLDLYLYNLKVDMNRSYVHSELEKLGIAKFEDEVIKTANAAFGNGERTEFTDTLIDYILNGNTYGVSSIGVVAKYYSDSKSKSKLKYVLYRMFPPAEKMKNLYPSLNRIPILLPIYWIYRWIEILFTRKDRIKRIVNIAKGDAEHEIVHNVLNIVGLNEDVKNFY